MPHSPCLSPGCPNLAAYRGYCLTHSRKRGNARYARHHANEYLYRTKRWQLLRRRVLGEQPICAWCGEALAEHVDHIQPLNEGGAPWARANVQGLCAPCHSAKTRREQAVA